MEHSAIFSGCCLAAALLVLVVALAAPHRLGAAAAAAAPGDGSETNWHVVSVNSLLPNTVCTSTKGPAGSLLLLPSYALVPECLSHVAILFEGKEKKTIASHD